MMNDQATRAAIVAEAVSWERTPYHAHAKVKGVGVDCAMFPAAVYEAVGLAPPINPQYTQDWMMHRDEELFLGFVTPYAHEITRADVLPGDFVIWKFGRTFSHSAIVIDMPEVIHAAIQGASVFRTNMDQDSDLAGRKCRFFSVIGAS
jgi:cell wall-associated NlpC family hydrolase